MKNIAVVLAGCGVYDGSEINEVVLALLELEKAGMACHCFAPDKEQLHAIHHVKGEEGVHNRNVLTESARIVRGEVTPLSELNAQDFDALVVPGGFGVAKNLSTFAVDGAAFSIDPQFESVMRAFKENNKAAAYMCIAPVLLPKVYPGVKCTIGTDEATASIIEQLGGTHINCQVDEVAIDEENRVVTTPAYMLAQSRVEAHKGIEKLIKALQRV